MTMTKKQKEIVIGCILGDAYLQKTGKRNARLRLEHSVKQREYIFWKWKAFEKYMQDKPKLMKRYNPVFKKQYQYFRCQSHSSPIFGKLRQLFYLDGIKQIPNVIEKLLSKRTLAVWYMDDGYYYQRDKTAYMYLAKFPKDQTKKLIKALKNNFGLNPKLEIKKTKTLDLKFSAEEAEKLIRIIKPYIIPSMAYKIRT